MRCALAAVCGASGAGMGSARAASATAGAGAPSCAARRLARGLAAAAAALLAAVVLLVDGGIADLRRPLRRVTTRFRALLDVVGLTLLLRRVLRFPSSGHAPENAHHVPVSAGTGCARRIATSDCPPWRARW